MLTVDQLTVEFVHEGYAVRPLDGLEFAAQPGELVVLLGPSGSGKTTLLSCLAVPLLLTGTSRKEAFRRARELIETVGLTDRAGYRPARLSGGQQQRVALARGLAHDPDLLLADEPTANLDHIQAEQVIRLLRDLRSRGRIIVVSTHDDRLLPVADRIVSMAPDSAADRQGPVSVSFTAGESIFEQGDRSDLVYVIDEGEVDVVRVLAGGGEEHIRVMGPGEYFGELGPTLGFPRSASVRARTDLSVTAYGIIDFRELVLGEE